MPRRFPTLRAFKASYISSECGDSSEGDECCICLDIYDDNAHQAVKATSNSECEHVFGRQCLEAWIHSLNPTRNLCPVCRRKWYTRRGMSLPAPRYAVTTQVLGPPTWSSTSIRGRVESRTFRRISLRQLRDIDDSSVAQQVERLVGDLEALESLERTGTSLLDQGARVRLQQVEDRIRAFLQRDGRRTFLQRVVEPFQNATDSVSNHLWHDVAVPGVGGSRYMHDPVIAELEHEQNSQSIIGIASRHSTTSPPEVQVVNQHRILLSDSFQTHAGSTLERLEPSTPPNSISNGQRVWQTQPHSRVEVTPFLRQSSISPSQPLPESQSLRLVSTQTTEEGLPAHESQSVVSSSMQGTALSPRLTDALVNTFIPDSVRSSSSLSSIASAWGTDSSSTNRRTVYDRRNPVPHLSRDLTLFLRRTNSTSQSLAESQLDLASMQLTTSPAMAQRPAGRRSRMTATNFRCGLSRIMSFLNVRNFFGRNRER